MKKLLLFGLVATMFASCSTEVAEQVVKQTRDIPQSITINIEEGSRVYLENGKCSLNRGDIFHVFNKINHSDTYTYNGNTDANGNPIIELTTPTYYTTHTETDKVVVVYSEGTPTLSVVKENEEDKYGVVNSLKAIVKSTQKYQKNSFASGSAPMVYIGDDINAISMKNVCGWINIQLTGNGQVLKKVELWGNKNEQLATSSMVSSAATVSATDLSVSEVNNADTKLIINFDSSDALSSEVTKILFSTLPVEFTDGFTVKITCTDGTVMTRTTNKNIKIGRNQIQPMTPFEYTGEQSDIDAPEEPDKTDDRLKGTILGTLYSVDYDNGSVMSTTVNTKENVFDGDYETFFASYDRSRTWVGLDLGEKHVITKVGWSPRIDQQNRVELALIEGANSPDFSDALPIYIIKNKGENNIMHYAEVNCSRGFRYVRYVSPNDMRCNLSELAFYGTPSEGDDSKLYQLTNLPTVIINTPNAEEVTSKEYELSSNVYIISENGTKLLATSNTGVRGRGNASWEFPKKPYRLKFSSKQSPLGAPASAKKWTLINNYGDKTLMRNILAFEVSRRVGQNYTPFCYPVDLIMNGEYRGCYQLCDQVEVATGRVEAKNGYLIEIDAYAPNEEVWFYSNRGIPITIKYPDGDEITQSQRNLIIDDFNRLESAIFASNFTDPVSGYRTCLDLDSFLRNFIIGEFCGNTDTFWSVYMYKNTTSGKLYTGPAWDYDLGFENDIRTYPINSLSDYIYATRGSVASDAVRRLVTRIVKEDPLAKQRLVELWEMACNNGGLSDLNEYTDRIAELLQESQELNFKRWKTLDQLVHANFQALGSYDKEVQTVKDYITERLKTFDILVR